MRIFHSPIYGDVDEPESFAEIVELATRPIEGVHYNVHMWRGQANIGWPVHSGAYRRVRLTREVVREVDVSSYEKRLMRSARFNNLNVVDGRELSDFDLLARLQHHGAATRLVDASRNSLVGLFFAVNSHPDEYGLLAGFHAYHLGGYEGNPEDRRYNEVILGAAQHDYPQTWSPPVVTPRVAAQHSQFVYSRISNHPKGSLAISNDRHAFLPIAISPGLKPEVRRLLSEVFDIRESTLFPDLHGFCDINSALVHPSANNRW